MAPGMEPRTPLPSYPLMVISARARRGVHEKTLVPATGTSVQARGTTLFPARGGHSRRLLAVGYRLLAPVVHIRPAGASPLPGHHALQPGNGGRPSASTRGCRRSKRVPRSHSNAVASGQEPIANSPVRAEAREGFSRPLPAPPSHQPGLAEQAHGRYSSPSLPVPFSTAAPCGGCQ